MRYPKIQTLWKRDAENKYRIIEGDYSKDEFENIKQWHITEKIDGMNIRVMIYPQMTPNVDYFADGQIKFRGRTDKAQIPTFLLIYLQSIFKPDIVKVFKEAEMVILYGEGYGAKIQKGGGNYRKDVSFILFDVWIDGWWLNQENVADIAEKLGIKTVPYLGRMTEEEIVEYIKSKPKSWLAQEEMVMEGIVARTEPLLLYRNKSPLLWKLKIKDYEQLESD